MVYMTKDTIMGIIDAHDKDIAFLKKEVGKDYPDAVCVAIENRLEFLEDNVYRYRMQAKAWGLR